MRTREDEIAIARALVLLVASRIAIEALCAPHLVVDLLEFFLAVWAGEQFAGHCCVRLQQKPGYRHSAVGFRLNTGIEAFGAPHLVVDLLSAG